MDTSWVNEDGRICAVRGLAMGNTWDVPIKKGDPALTGSPPTEP